MAHLCRIVLGCGLLLAVPSASACQDENAREYAFQLAEPRDVFVKVLAVAPESLDSPWELRFTARLESGTLLDLGALQEPGATQRLQVPAGRHVLRVVADGGSERRWEVLLVEVLPDTSSSGGQVNPATRLDTPMSNGIGCDLAPATSHRAGDASLAAYALAVLGAAAVARRRRHYMF